MIVRSFNCEMGYEGIAVMPYAYALHLRGELEGTVSGAGSEPFYYFSPKHEIDPTPRDFAHTAEAAKVIPNMWIHKPLLDKSAWVPPPYAEHYADRAIRFEKPTVVVYNRYNIEWGRPPINFFDLEALRDLFRMLLPKYDVVYFNVRGQEALEDNAHSMELGDYEMIAAEFPAVRVIHDLVAEHGGGYNEVQLRVFAGCRRFITMNGFPSILASYFGGENIIYSRRCKELLPTVNSFYNWYGDFGGSAIKVVHTVESLLALVLAKWVEEEPRINILVRCHKRQGGLERLLRSVVGQSHLNWHVYASWHDEGTWEYLRRYPVQKVQVQPTVAPEPILGDSDYAKPFVPNLYLNALMEQVGDGYVLFLDDDDLLEPGALGEIAGRLSEDSVLLWRAVSETGRLIPSDENFGKVVAGDISGIAFAFHVKHRGLCVWEPYRRGDFRVIRNLCEHLPSKWVDASWTRIGRPVPARHVRTLKRVARGELRKARAEERKKRREEAAKLIEAFARGAEQVLKPAPGWYKENLERSAREYVDGLRPEFKNNRVIAGIAREAFIAGRSNPANELAELQGQSSAGSGSPMA